MKLNWDSIRVRIVLRLFLILIISSFGIISIVVVNYRNDMLTSTKKIFSANKEMLIAVIRNIMIRGEAPLVVNTLSSITTIKEYKELAIYRSDGTAAFSDYATLESVNHQLGGEQFEKTPRTDPHKIKSPYFDQVIRTKKSVEVEKKDPKEMEYLFPIPFTEECGACHNPNIPLRGVAVFTVSISDIYNRIHKIFVYSPILFLAVFFLIGLFIMLYVNKLIIHPLLRIGETVQDVGKGNLDTNIPYQSKDEIGDLSERINAMIKGLKERFILSRYVSRTTEQFIHDGLDKTTTQKKQLTVLFSDIRGFTSYSEKNDPDKVVFILNKILSVQADIIEKFDGDVDNFIGDAIMGVFTDPYEAVLASQGMIKSVIDQDQIFKTGLRVGIGLATGEIISGDIGSEKRRKNTVIGDTVNLASRLASLAKPNMLLVSELSNQLLHGRIHSELVADQKIKGKSGIVNFYIIRSIIKSKEEK